MRRVSALKVMAQQEKNRAHAADHTAEITRLIARDVDQHILQLSRHVEKLEDEAYAIVQWQPDLAVDYAPAPAMVAAQHEPQVKAFYDRLVARGKTKLQAIVAVMRKLLHAIHGMLRTNTDFRGEKFYAIAA